jgi:hypothetical protein
MGNYLFYVFHRIELLKEIKILLFYMYKIFHIINF